MRRLILLRHAHASDHSESGRDRDRPLSDIGREQAASQAAALQLLGVDPDRVIVSPARRAEQTATIVAEVLGVAAPPKAAAKIYDALPGELLRVLEEYPGEEVLLVGHNPGISGLATLLSGESIGLSAGGFVMIDFEPETQQPLQPGDGRVGSYRPRPA